MKSQETKTEFIRLRAEGKSYSHIAGELKIAKSTCTEWEREYREEIDELKKDQLAELYQSYHMTREARIKRLGDTLKLIDEQIQNADFSEVPPARLLDYQLKYMIALKTEYGESIMEEKLKDDPFDFGMFGAYGR